MWGCAESNMPTVRRCGQLWQCLAPQAQQEARFFSDRLAAYARVIPQARHRGQGKVTNQLERFNRSGGPQYPASAGESIGQEDALLCQIPRWTLPTVSLLLQPLQCRNHYLMLHYRFHFVVRSVLF
jgi:hypothetical protein